MEYKGKDIIVIDGADGVGKSTQVELLKTKYKGHEFIKFPRYNEYTGKMITAYLNGDLDNIITSIEMAGSLYTMDRLYWFNSEYDNEKHYIFDRYTTSNMIHMGANILTTGGTMEDVKQYVNNLYRVEHNTLHIPKPSLVIYLDAPVEQLIKNLHNTHKILDKHENIETLKNVNIVKEYLIKRYHWKVINCFDGENMRSIEDINTDICNIINKRYRLSTVI